MKAIETMGGVDVLTRDLADMPNGTSFVTQFGERTINPREYPISGDEIARIWSERPNRERILRDPAIAIVHRIEGGEPDGADCGA